MLLSFAYWMIASPTSDPAAGREGREGREGVRGLVKGGGISGGLLLARAYCTTAPPTCDPDSGRGKGGWGGRLAEACGTGGWKGQRVGETAVHLSRDPLPREKRAGGREGSHRLIV